MGMAWGRDMWEPNLRGNRSSGRESYGRQFRWPLNVHTLVACLPGVEGVRYMFSACASSLGRA